MADLTNLVGPFEVNINGRYAVTVKSITADERRNTAQHYGPYGTIGQSAGSGAAISLTLRLAIPKAGLEFNFANELAGGKSFLLARGLNSAVRYRFEGVIFGGQSLSADAEQGRSELTVNATAGAVV